MPVLRPNLQTTSDQRSQMPSTVIETQGSVSMASSKKHRNEEELEIGGGTKRTKLGGVQELEKDIRWKYNLDDNTTVEEMDYLIDIQREKVKEAELRFLRSRLCRKEQDLKNEEFVQFGLDVDASCVQSTFLSGKEENSLQWQELLSGCMEVASTAVDFTSMVVSAPVSVDPLLCFSPFQSFDVSCWELESIKS